ncbi:MAG TPA: ABC transporter ATP-binding protein [Actinomycetota bacterium]|nr:ABC transporter ATP-binding protein [Actinomycetota bacterium]
MAGDGATRVLKLDGVYASYGPVEVLRDISLEVHQGEIACLLGANAAGKTTTLKTILGMVKPTAGEITLRGERIDGENTQKIVAQGVTMVPEGRRLFGKMSVRENLEIGTELRKDEEKIAEDMERALDLFPRLRERLDQKAGTLSGGEQQMCAIARALMADPKVLLMDEPSMGLAPILVEQVFDVIKEINKQGTTIFLVEQNANMALSVADRGYVLQTGEVVMSDSAKALRENQKTREAYLGELEE